MKITRVNFKGRQNIMGVGNAKSQLAPGEPTDTAWGGGPITSMEYDPVTACLAIRKATRFERTNAGERGVLKSFDVALVPWINVDCGCACDEMAETPKVVEEMPPAKPIQQQRR